MDERLHAVCPGQAVGSRCLRPCSEPLWKETSRNSSVGLRRAREETGPTHGQRQNFLRQGAALRLTSHAKAPSPSRLLIPATNLLSGGRAACRKKFPTNRRYPSRAPQPLPVVQPARCDKGAAPLIPAVYARGPRVAVSVLGEAYDASATRGAHGLTRRIRAASAPQRAVAINRTRGRMSTPFCRPP